MNINNTVRDKAKIWYESLSESDSITMCKKHFPNIPYMEIEWKHVDHIYLSEHPDTPAPAPITREDTNVCTEINFNNPDKMAEFFGGKKGTEEKFTGGQWEFMQLMGTKQFTIHSKGDSICYTDTLDSEETQKANAQRIVTAVNNHDALVSALKDLCYLVDLKCDWTEFNRQEIETTEKAKAIINNISKQG